MSNSIVISLDVFHIVIFFKSLRVNALVYSHASTRTKSVIVSITLHEVLLVVLFIYLLHDIICTIILVLLRSLIPIERLIRLYN